MPAVTLSPLRKFRPKICTVYLKRSGAITSNINTKLSQGKHDNNRQSNYHRHLDDSVHENIYSAQSESLKIVL